MVKDITAEVQASASTPTSTSSSSSSTPSPTSSKTSTLLNDHQDSHKPHRPPRFHLPPLDSQSLTKHDTSTTSTTSSRGRSQAEEEKVEVLDDNDNQNKSRTHPSTQRTSLSQSKSKSKSKSKSVPSSSTSSSPLETTLSHPLSLQSSEPNYPSYPLPLTKTRTEPKPGAIYIDWEEGDRENPFNWSRGKKWFTVSICFLFASVTAINATGYSSGSSQAIPELDTSYLTYVSGSTTYLTAIAFSPMVLAPISEIFGRKPIYIASGFLFCIMYLPQALAPNIASIVIARFFQGIAASTGNSLVAGTCSDVFEAKERGTSMMLFSLLIFIGQALGPLTSGYIAQELGWRWIFWIQMILAGVSLSLLLLFLSEPRGPVILSKRAQRLTKETGRLHRCLADDERASFAVMIRTSLIRPFVYLLTEPVIIAISLWVGFAWATIFLLVSSVPIVFAQYGWTEAQIGLVFASIGLGGMIGYLGNLHQEHLYHKAILKHSGKPPPEARLYWSCFGAILFPICLFLFAWLGRPQIHPVGPIIALVMINASVYWIYVSIFSYVADCYERYASSGLAAQSFARNILAAFFPLFVKPMYNNLTPPVASSTLGAIALVLGACPFILFRYGASIRKRSRVVRQMEMELQEAEKEKQRDEMAQRRDQREKGLTVDKEKAGGEGQFKEA